MGQSKTSCPEAMAGWRIAVNKRNPGKRTGITGRRSWSFLNGENPAVNLAWPVLDRNADHRARPGMEDPAGAVPRSTPLVPEGVHFWKKTRGPGGWGSVLPSETGSLGMGSRCFLGSGPFFMTGRTTEPEEPLRSGAPAVDSERDNA
jgi:hypothetical protein